MEHSAKADFHGGLGRKGAWRPPFVCCNPYAYWPSINALYSLWYRSRINPSDTPILGT
jgi:hypothetical protein